MAEREDETWHAVKFEVERLEMAGGALSRAAVQLEGRLPRDLTVTDRIETTLRCL